MKDSHVINGDGLKKLDCGEWKLKDKNDIRDLEKQISTWLSDWVTTNSFADPPVSDQTET